MWGGETFIPRYILQAEYCSVNQANQESEKIIEIGRVIEGWEGVLSSVMVYYVLLELNLCRGPDGGGASWL